MGLKVILLFALASIANGGVIEKTKHTSRLASAINNYNDTQQTDPGVAEGNATLTGVLMGASNPDEENIKEQEDANTRNTRAANYFDDNGSPYAEPAFIKPIYERLSNPSRAVRAAGNFNVQPEQTSPTADDENVDSKRYELPFDETDGGVEEEEEPETLGEVSRSARQTCKYPYIRISCNPTTTTPTPCPATTCACPTTVSYPSACNGPSQTYYLNIPTASNYAPQSFVITDPSAYPATCSPSCCTTPTPTCPTTTTPSPCCDPPSCTSNGSPQLFRFSFPTTSNCAPQPCLISDPSVCPASCSPACPVTCPPACPTTPAPTCPTTTTPSPCCDPLSYTSNGSPQLFRFSFPTTSNCAPQSCLISDPSVCPASCSPACPVICPPACPTTPAPTCPTTTTPPLCCDPPSSSTNGQSPLFCWSFPQSGNSSPQTCLTIDRCACSATNPAVCPPTPTCPATCPPTCPTTPAPPCCLPSSTASSDPSKTFFLTYPKTSNKSPCQPNIIISQNQGSTCYPSPRRVTVTCPSSTSAPDPGSTGILNNAGNGVGGNRLCSTINAVSRPSGTDPCSGKNLCMISNSGNGDGGNKISSCINYVDDGNMLCNCGQGKGGNCLTSRLNIVTGNGASLADGSCGSTVIKSLINMIMGENCCLFGNCPDCNCCDDQSCEDPCCNQPSTPPAVDPCASQNVYSCSPITDPCNPQLTTYSCSPVSCSCPAATSNLPSCIALPSLCCKK